MAEGAAQLGRYSLLRLVGRGGMAEVWKAKAQGPAGFEKIVAIKRVLPHLTQDPEFIAMFIEEAKLVARLDHTNIVRVYDFGSTESADGGTDYFLAMEYVPGRNLSDLLRRLNEEDQTLPPEVALLVAAQTARALDYAHSGAYETDGAPIVHRDVSPQNLMVSYRGEVKIADFGIAKVINRLSTTGFGTLKGKASYVSPEQANFEILDGRSDLFSLGTVLYEMVAGKRLFDWPAAEEIVGEIRRFDPAKSPKINALDGPVADILRRALQQDREKRFASAADMERAIREVLGAEGLEDARVQLAPLIQEAFSSERQEETDSGSVVPTREIVLTSDLTGGSPVMGRPPDRQDGTMATRMFSGRVAGFAGAFLAIVAMTVAATVAVVDRREQAAPVPVVVADFENTTGDEALDSVAGLYRTALQRSRALDVLSQPRMLDALRANDQAEAARALVRIDEKTARAIGQFVDAEHLIVGSVDFDRGVYTIQLRIEDPLSEDGTDARTFTDSGPEVTKLANRVALRTRRLLREPDPHQTAAAPLTQDLTAYNSYFEAERLIAQNEYARAQFKLETALEIDPNFSLAWWRLAYVRNWRGVGGDQEALDEAFELSRRFPGSVPEKDLELMRALRANIEGDSERATAILIALLNRHPNEKEILFTIGDLLYHEGDPQGIPYLERAVEIDPVYEIGREHLLRAYIHAGRQEDYLRQAEAYVDRVRSPGAFTKAAQAMVFAGNLDRAEELYDEMYKLYPTDSRAYWHRMFLHLWRGNPSKAETVIDENPRAAFYARGRLRAWQGRVREADDIYSQNLERLRRTPNVTQTGDARQASEYAYFRALFLGPDVDIEPQVNVSGTTDRIVLYHLIQAYCRLGAQQRAAELALEVQARSFMTEYVDAYFGCRSRKDTESLAAIRDSAARLDFNYRSAHLLLLAQCERTHGNRAAALAALEVLLAHPGMRDDYMLHWGAAKLLQARIHAEDDDPAAAVAAYERLLGEWENADAGWPPARQARDELAALRKTGRP